MFLLISRIDRVQEMLYLSMRKQCCGRLEEKAEGESMRERANVPVMLSSNETEAVVCTNLTKVYEGGTTALKDLTLSIERGTSFGLLGENVAGYWLEKRELLLY